MDKVEAQKAADLEKSTRWNKPAAAAQNSAASLAAEEEVSLVDLETGAVDQQALADELEMTKYASNLAEEFLTMPQTKLDLFLVKFGQILRENLKRK